MRPNSRQGRNSDSRRPRSDDRDDKNFEEELENRIKFFLVSEHKELDLEPMNSYKRRLAHKIATQYKLETDSRGEEPGRYVCLIKTESAIMPEGRSRPKLWDFGIQTFYVNPGKNGIHMALKMDGSLEVYDEADKQKVVDERLVKSREIRIRQGKIVTPDDSAF